MAFLSDIVTIHTAKVFTSGGFSSVKYGFQARGVLLEKSRDQSLAELAWF